MEKTSELPVSKEQLENLSTGYIKLFRSIRKHWIWKDENKLKWWIDILLEVNHADKMVTIGFDLIECKRGQSVMSLENWAYRWRVDKSTVRRFFDLLRKDFMICTENLQKTTRLTVSNHWVYNDQEHIEQLKNNSETTPKQLQNNSNKKDKNYKNGKNIQIRPKGLTASFEADRQGQSNLKKEYEELIQGLEGKDHTESWLQVKEFILSKKPIFIEPYIDAWNIFALNYHLQKGPIKITPGRRKKFSSRIQEEGFEFLEILSKVKGNDFLRGHNDRNWKVDFDFIVRSEETYTRILEEKYEL